MTASHVDLLSASAQHVRDDGPETLGPSHLDRDRAASLADDEMRLLTALLVLRCSSSDAQARLQDRGAGRGRGQVTGSETTVDCDGGFKEVM